MKFTITIETDDPELPTLLAHLALLMDGGEGDKESAFNALYLVVDVFFDVYGATDKDRLEALEMIKNKAELLDGRPET